MLRFFLLFLIAFPFWADDAACDAKLAKVAGERGADLKVCTVTDRLVPNRPVIFAVLNFDEQSPQFGNKAVVLDAASASAGRRQVIYEDRLGGIDLQPFLFRGKKTLFAISDFDRTGHIGWAVAILLDTGSSLQIRYWDPATGGFQPLTPWATGEDGPFQEKSFYVEAELRGMIEVQDGVIRLPSSRPVVYNLERGRFVKAVAAVAAAPQPSVPSVCGSRKTCRVATSTPAGKSATGSPLTVVELTLGLKDKSEDAPDEGCRDGKGGFNGGVEYWLLAPPAGPVRLLALCNDGYGAAGVGDDEVEVQSNRLIYTQEGGSNDRWKGIRTVQLSPRRGLSIDSCGYRATSPGTGVATHADLSSLKVVSVAQDDRDPALTNKDPGCPAMTGASNAQPGPGLMAAIAVPAVSRPDAPQYRSGTPLGSCAVRVGTADTPGFGVYGTPLVERRAELRMIAVDRQTLVVQLYDPQPAPAGASWVQSDHLEIWTGKDGTGEHNRPEAAATAQIGVDLDGKVYAGLGKPALPVVKHSKAIDESGRPVHLFELRWPDDDALTAGVAVVYSQADRGRQSYVFATTGIVRNRPLYLPAFSELPLSCGVADGRWNITANSGELQ
jgi:hypothetical protein